MTLDLIIWDVNHGSSTYICTPNEKKFIIDLGIGSINNNCTFSPLQYLRNQYNVSEIDELIITHPDLDHIQDIPNVKLNWSEFSKTKVNCFRRPGQIPIDLIQEKLKSCRYQEEKECFTQYLEMNARYNGQIDKYDNPEISSNNGGVSFDFIYPTPDISTNIENNYSIVSIIEYVGVKILIPGDNESPSWRFLLNNPAFLKKLKDVDIFVAPHHGRESGYYSELFEHFTPKLVIISDGPVTTTSVTNFYSKHAEGWNIYKKGIKEFRKCVTTRNDGAIHIKVGYNANSEVFLNINAAK